MKNFLIGTIFLGLASLGYSQSRDFEKNEIRLSALEVTPMELSALEVTAMDQNYLDKVSNEPISSKVFTLEEQVSSYDIKEHPLFNADYNRSYQVRFDRGNEKIVATFNQNGKILNTYESYRDLNPPIAIMASVYGKYPNWIVQGTTYTVNYNGKEAEKTFAVRMEKDGVKKKLKLDLEGNIME